MFVEKNPLPQEVLDKKWRRRGSTTSPPPPWGPIACYLLVMVRLGSEPNVTMDAVAAMTRGFLHGHGPGPPGGLLLPGEIWRGRGSPWPSAPPSMCWWCGCCWCEKTLFRPHPAGLSLSTGCTARFWTCWPRRRWCWPLWWTGCCPGCCSRPCPGGSDEFTKWSGVLGAGGPETDRRPLRPTALGGTGGRRRALCPL